MVFLSVLPFSFPYEDPKSPMPIESAGYINQLEPAYPASTDQISEADNHLRLLKAVLQNTFPNISGPVSASDEDLSNLFVMPAGIISMWFGSSGTVPTGWAVCNGQTVSRSDGEGTITTPDMRNFVPIGAGSVVPQGTTAGATTASATTGSAGAHVHTITGGEHTHTGEVQGHALTVAEMPSHSHTVEFGTGSSTSYAEGGNGGSQYSGTTRSSGLGNAHGHGLVVGSATHSHTVSNGGAHTHSVTVSTLQPSLGLHFIMKV